MIVTTNFDRLIESALEAEGVTVQVIDSAAKARGMEPMQHMACTVIKLHGDYASLDQRNTVDELASYPAPMQRLLARVLEEYGLIVSGWSGDWDAALVSALDASANRRYPLYWVSRSSPGAIASRLTARSGSHVILGLTADEFFPDLLARVDALEAMSESPDSINLALGQLKRALPDPVRHIEVRELFEAELAKLSEFLSEAVKWPQPQDWEAAQVGLTEIESRSGSLLKLYTSGIVLDRDRQHTDLWVEVLRRALAARKSEWANSWWLTWLHVPAILLMRAGAMAALLARHEDVGRRIMQEPTWHSIFVDGDKPHPAWSVLHPWRVFGDKLNNLPRFALKGSKYYWPESRLVREDLQQFIEPLLGGDDYSVLHDRAEFRAALAYQFAAHQFQQPMVGEYIGDQKWTWRAADGEKEQPTLGIDFADYGDRDAWGLTESNGEWFDSQIDDLYEELRRGRRFG